MREGGYPGTGTVEDGLPGGLSTQMVDPRGPQQRRRDYGMLGWGKGRKWSHVLLSHRKVESLPAVPTGRPSPQVLLGKEEAGKLAF